MDTRIISVGGSIIAPDQVDTGFLVEFTRIAVAWLNVSENRRLVLVAGGGAPARVYQSAFREVTSRRGIFVDTLANVSKEVQDASADWIGVMATRLNAELLRACFGTIAADPVVTNPMEAPEVWKGDVLVAAGWKPGFSSDNDAVLLAEKYGAKEVINLSNIDYVYDKDPKKNPDAKPLDRISWADFCAMVGDKWVPGMNAPFDPIASKRAAKLGLTVICASGHDIDNLRLILDNGDYRGTTITA